MVLTLVDPGSTDITPLIHHPVLWASAVGVFAVVVLQSVIYFKAIRKAAPAADLSPDQVTGSVRSGAVAAIGPSLAVALIAISLLPLFGTPAVLTRIGLVGSAAFDVAAAGISAGTQGAQLGGPTYTQKIFAIAFAAMTIGGLVWMLTALILTPIMSKGGAKLRKVNPAVMAIVPTAALLGAFFTLAFQEVLKSPAHLGTMIASAAAMAVCLVLAHKFRLPWLREWGLGVAIIVALSAAYVMTAASKTTRQEPFRMPTLTTAEKTAGFSAFDRTTSVWGPITLGLGLIISLAAALYAAFGTGVGVTPLELVTAVGAVLATFGIIAVIEPVSYFPILGRSAMYQAFLIGNIANKLLPAAIVAQANLGEKPGTRRAELIAGSAIIGAVLVHITTLILFVGVLGTWLVGMLPAPLIATARSYILPAIFGAVVLQSVLAMKSRRTTIIAVVVAAAFVFVVVPLVPALTYFATALAVVITIAASWLARSKAAPATPTP